MAASDNLAEPDVSDLPPSKPENPAPDEPVDCVPADELPPPMEPQLVRGKNAVVGKRPPGSDEELRHGKS